MDIVKKYILGDEIDIKGIMEALTEFRNEVITSIKSGDKRFLPNGSPKEIEAYADPSSEQSVRGVFTWNILFPDNQIELPAKVSLLKLKIFKESDILPLKETHPDIYNTIIEKIFNDDTGVFVTKKNIVNYISYVNEKDKKWFENIPPKWKTKYKKLGPKEWNKFVEEYESADLSDPKIAKKYNLGDGVETKVRGMQVIAIPNKEDVKIPEWLDPYIDYSALINSILSPFKAVWELFGIRSIDEGKSVGGVNRKTKGYSTIIDF